MFPLGGKDYVVQPGQLFKVVALDKGRHERYVRLQATRRQTLLSPKSRRFSNWPNG